MKKFILLLAIVFLFGCSSMRSILSDEGKGYYDAAMRHGPIFVTTKTRSDKIWERAKQYIDLFSDMKLEIENDHLLRTYTSPTFSDRFDYMITRHALSKTSDSILFEVHCGGNAHTKEYAAIVGYFIDTGYPIPDDIIDPRR
jgi:hypothetical protein